MLVKWVAFLYTLHWHQGGEGLGVCGVSYVELLIFCELWAGERLVLEKAVSQYRRAGRSISVSAVPFGPGTDICDLAGFVGALFRALVCLLGGIIRRFVSYDIVPITVGFGTLGGKSVVMALLPGLVSRPRKVFKMCCWSCLVILLVLLLRCSVESYPFGTVLVILLVGFPLGVFLLVVMFRVLFLNLLVLVRFRLLSCLAWLVVLGCLVVGEFLGA